MILEMLETGPLAVNCYIVGDEETKQAAVIDPGGHAQMILDLVNKHGLSVKYIINTHSHWDHTGGNAELKQSTDAPILIHEAEADMLANSAATASLFGMSVPSSPPADQLLKEGDEVEVGAIKMRVLHLPGHSPGGIGLVFDKVAIVGDSLFCGSIGRTDLPGGNHNALLDNIRRKLFTLPDDTQVL
ncbi:MAG: MBL fold metallo-hydrolase, partial [Candidatus Alcyoniella australis]|nr:MBL fold metallo-hydrolase [Candidatus Alcyoniella australis]